MSKYRELLKDRDFRRFVTAGVISKLGDSLDFIAYGWLVYELTGSTVYLATVYAVSGLPALLLNVLPGVVVNYLRKRLVLAYSDLGRGVVTALVAVLFWTGLLEPWHLILLAFVGNAIEAFSAPAGMPFLQIMLKEDDYEHALGLDSGLSNVAELSGYATAGVLIGLIGPGTVIFINAVTFFLSALLTFLIRDRESAVDRTSDQETPQLSVKQFFLDIRESFAYVVQSRLILFVCLFAGLFNVLIVPFNSLQPAFISEVLGQDSEFVSIIAASFLVGMLIGNLVLPPWLQRRSKRTVFVCSGVLLGLAYVSLGQVHLIENTWVIGIVIGAIALLMGLALTGVSLPLQVSMMSHVDQVQMSRVTSFVYTLALAAVPIGSGLLAAVLTVAGINAIFVAAGALTTILFLLQLRSHALKDM